MKNRAAIPFFQRLMVRTGLVIGSVLAVTLLGYTAWAGREQEEAASRRGVAEATILAHTIAATVVPSFLTNDFGEVEAALQRFAAYYPDVHRVLVTDNRGRLRGEVRRRADGTPEASFDTTPVAVPTGGREQVLAGSEAHPRSVLVWHPLIDGAEANPGWVRLEYDTSAADRAAAGLWRDLRYAGTAALLLIAAGLAAALVRPLRALRRAAEFAGRLDRQAGQRLPAYRGAGEIEQLYSALNEASRRLNENQRNQRLATSTFDNTSEGILITDAEKRIVQVNAAFTEITGWGAAEVVGKTPAVLRSGMHDDAFYAAMWRSITARGHWRGQIWNRRKNGEAYAEMLNISAIRDESGRVSHYIGVFGDISDMKATERRLETMAHFDRLTGLPNRDLLMDRVGQSLARAQRGGHLFAVGFLDLDDFKPVNDSWGHEVGDRLLKQVAARLGNSMRSVDTVARIGGDEFVLLLDDLADTAEIPPTLERVLASVAEPYTVDGHDVVVTASIGVAVYPADGDDPQQLLASADQAMYEAKSAGRNVFRFHTPAALPAAPD